MYKFTWLIMCSSGDADDKSLCNVVSWCFEPSQPLEIILRLKENFIKRHIVQRTNRAEIRPEEQGENTEICQENSCNEIQLKGP